LSKQAEQFSLWCQLNHLLCNLSREGLSSSLANGTTPVALACAHPAPRSWTICNCKATKAVPGYDSASCKGPLCELFKKPEFPSLNFGLPKFDLPGGWAA
jgi:hypothetical protein